MRTLLIQCNSRNRRSTLSPVPHLPPELLASLFVHCAIVHHINSNALRRSVPTWVNVSYVCRYWRDVALDCPTLWSYHFVVSLRWTKELLARSKQASLKIYLEFEYGKIDTWWLSPVEELMKHAGRFEDLTLHLRDSNSYHVLSMLSARAPRLQNLQISAPGFQSELPFLPFQGDTPVLRTLILSDCPVSWHSFRLGSLTILDLFRLPDRIKQSTADFLATLRCMQNLTELYLDRLLASASGFLSSVAFLTFQKFSLPHLSRLVIEAPLTAIIALLSCVNIPLDAEARMKCLFERDALHDHYTLLPSLLAQRFATSGDQAPSSLIIRSLVMTFWMGRIATLLFSSWERDCDGFDSVMVQGRYWRCNIPLEVTIEWAGSRMMIEDIIGNICCDIPLTNVQTVHITCPPFSPAFWRKTLGHLQHVQYLKLSDGEMPDLASVLQVSLTAHEGEGNHDGQAYTAAPALEELELEDIKFFSEDASGNGISQRSLFDALSTRGVSGGRLTMTRCSMDGSLTLDTVRSWDDLISTPVVDEAGSHSYEAMDD